MTGHTGPLPVQVVTEALQKGGFAFPPQVAAGSLEELKTACKTIGFPLAIKVLGPLHKSDIGGVRLGITGMGEAEQAWHELMSIPGAAGVVVQKMVGGIEVILGASRTEGLGHLVMFGLGGIYTEVLKDVRFALAPLSREECRKMVTGIRGYPILEGIRGQEGISVELLIGYIERLGRLVSDFPAISEIDLNPLKGCGEGVYVVDARMILGAST